MAGGFQGQAATMSANLSSEVPDGSVVEAENIPAPPADRAVRMGIQQVVGNPVMSVMQAPVRLFRHLVCMKEDLVATKNSSEAERLVRGMKFDKFEEHVCALRYQGIPIINPDPHMAHNHPDKMPFVKIVTDIVDQYKLDGTTKNNLLNAKLCEESSMLNFDIKFNVGQPGLFYYGKFMAVNIGGKIDFCFMFYRLNFKIAADIVEHVHAKKFLWFTVGLSKTHDEVKVKMDQALLEDFQIFFRLRLFELLGGELEGLADTEPPDALARV
jgi:hypothetical protein